MYKAPIATNHVMCTFQVMGLQVPCFPLNGPIYAFLNTIKMDLQKTRILFVNVFWVFETSNPCRILSKN